MRLSFFLFALCFVFLVSLASVLNFVFMMEMGSKVNTDRNCACRSDAHILGDFECRGLLGPPGLDHGFPGGAMGWGENEQLQTARNGQEASDVVFSSEAVRS